MNTFAELDAWQEHEQKLKTVVDPHYFPERKSVLSTSVLGQV